MITFSEFKEKFNKANEPTFSEPKRMPGGGIKYRGEMFPGYNKPKRAKKGAKHKYRVLAREGEKTKIVNFGFRGMKDYCSHKDPKRKKNFRSRHGCDKGKLSKLSAKYWSCQVLWGSLKRCP